MNDEPVQLNNNCCVLLSPYVDLDRLRATIDDHVTVYGSPETATIMHALGFEVTPRTLYDLDDPTRHKFHVDGTDRFRLVRGTSNASCILYHYNRRTLHCGSCTMTWQWWKKYAKSCLLDVLKQIEEIITTATPNHIDYKVPDRDATIDMLHKVWKKEGTLEIVDPLAKTAPIWDMLRPYLSVETDTVFVPAHNMGQQASQDERLVVVTKTSNRRHVVFLDDTWFFANGANRHEPVQTPHGTYVFYQQHASAEGLELVAKDEP